MTDADLLRYSRHILLDEVGVEGQERLQQSHALIVGVGGLGAPASLYLGGAGLGHITLVDPDTVDLTNLQRQICHTLDRVGQPKAESAQEAIAALNPHVQVHTVIQRADEALLDQLVPQVDVVLDCSDNFLTRQTVNAACMRHQVPLVCGAVIRFDGQVSVYDPRQPQSPCYACVFPPGQQFEEIQCATMGVLAPLVGVIGSLQAAEAIKLLVGTGTSLAGRLLMLDGLNMQWSQIGVPRDLTCTVCGHRPQAS